MTSEKDLEDFGRKEARNAAKILGTVHRGTVYRDPPPFQGLVAFQRDIALKAYVDELFDISKEDMPNRTQTDIRTLLIQQIGKMLIYPSFKKLVDQNEVGGLLSSYEQVWAGVGEYRLDSCKKINAIFQNTQSNYASSKGIISAIYGFRMVGQAKTSSGNPFFIGDMEGVDAISVRLSFLLRYSDSKASSVRRVLSLSATGMDLSDCWGQCTAVHFSAMNDNSRTGQSKNLKAIYKGGDALCELYPLQMSGEIRKWNEDLRYSFIEQAKGREDGGRVAALVKNTLLTRLAGTGYDADRSGQAYNRKM